MSTETLLHLVDPGGQPVEPTVRLAVEAAYTRVVRNFRTVDEAVIADLAESIAGSIAVKRDIRAIKRYAFAALKGRVLDWLRAKASGREIPIGHGAELDAASHGTEDPGFASVETERLLEQMKARLGERDRLVLVLIKGGHGNPAEVAAALHVTYGAAAKAIQRTKDRMAQLLSIKRHAQDRPKGLVAGDGFEPPAFGL